MNKNNKTLVFVGAHPDDESFGPGATLARYSAAGVKVYCICATGGEAGTVEPKHLEGYDSIKSLRADELRRAGEALGLSGIFHLGYRDSGMRGTLDNNHQDSLAMASLDEAAGRIVKIFRQIRPDVVITHDAGGSYGHPDHIATHEATNRAFYASGDSEQYPGTGTPFQPAKLYYMVRPHGMMRIAVKLMPLFGQDPHHFGRNRDIDLTRTAGFEYPVHAIIRLTKQDIEAHNRAADCHASQFGGGGGRRGGIFRIINTIERFRQPRNHFMRAYPSPTRHREKDLFEGLE